MKRGFVVSSGRLYKARKMEAVLKDYLHTEEFVNHRVLDVGCGDGQIAEYLAASNEVFAVDIDNQLLLEYPASVRFEKVDSTILPFPEGFFDIVISNHVIEHIENQALHLREIHRVLKKDGICYLAAPNRNFPIEPHYRIPLIHYLPPNLFHRFLLILGKYKENLYLLRHDQMVRLFERHGFEHTEYTGKILCEPEKYWLETRFTRWFPAFLLETLDPWMPTNIFVLRKTVHRRQYSSQP